MTGWTPSSDTHWPASASVRPWASILCSVQRCFDQFVPACSRSGLTLPIRRLLARARAALGAFYHATRGRLYALPVTRREPRLFIGVGLVRAVLLPRRLPAR